MVNPGLIQLILIFLWFSENSDIKHFVNPLIALLDEPYPLNSVKPFSPTIEPILTIEHSFFLLQFYTFVK